jgi:hypothetical protein
MNFNKKSDKIEHYEVSYLIPESKQTEQCCNILHKLSPIIKENAMILNFLVKSLLYNYYTQKVIIFTVLKKCNEEWKQIIGNN